MDIGSGKKYPSCALSNFSPHHFVVDEVYCASMEGFLQSLKFSGPEMQKHICTLIGIKAKRSGSKKRWQTKQILYWKGKEIKRDSEEYQKLLDRAFVALSKNSGFRKALLSTKQAVLTHSIGRSKQSETVLTKKEFCSRLMKIREILGENNENQG